MNTEKKKSFTVPYSLVQATYWMTACAVLGYALVYLQALGFNNFTAGIITAAGRVLGALLGPIIAAFLDNHPKFPTARMNVPLLLSQTAIFGILQFFGRNDGLTGVLFAMAVGLFVTTNSVVLRFCGDCAVTGYRLNYGIARGIGSLAYILPSVGLGIIFSKIPGSYLPAFGIGLLLLQLAVNYYAGTFFRGQRSLSLKPEAETGSSSLRRFLEEEPLFTRLLLGIMLLFIGYYFYATFLINIVRNVGGDSATMGAVAGVAAAIEIPFMFALSRLRKKWRLSSLIVFSVIAFSLKILVTALIRSIPALFVSQILQGFGYALYAASIVQYVFVTIPARNQAKAQSLVYTMETMSGVIASLVAGKLYDLTTVRVTLLAGFCITLSGAALLCSGIRKTE